MSSTLSPFISIEGSEGVGKSTFIKSLSSLLAKKVKVHCTSEPGGTPLGLEVRRLFSSPPGAESISSMVEFMLVSAARAEHVEKVIVPQLHGNSWILTDRFADSSRVYQGFLGGLDEDFVEQTLQKTTGGLEPDLTLVLDCPSEICLDRIHQRKGQDSNTDDGAARYDNARLEIHQQLRQGFLQLATRFPERILVLDASSSPGQLLEAGWKALQERFPAELGSGGDCSGSTGLKGSAKIQGAQKKSAGKAEGKASAKKTSFRGQKAPGTAKERQESRNN